MAAGEQSHDQAGDSSVLTDHGLADLGAQVGEGLSQLVVVARRASCEG
jgi:hypothetical protein